ncbi:MAG: ATP-dependent helicase [Chloroflexi bacterium HGW-Chloroflexi-3]|nr:MAG: ATP-dependent helicase [Chloroflexi bacterium HGW-Chloroflexi-3]
MSQIKSHKFYEPAYLKEVQDLLKNSGQREAYNSEVNCVVLAGPGSGKTKLLTLKIARLLHEKINEPQGIACITYSTECSREIKKRLDKIGIEEKRNIYIGTIHGFCLNQIIRPYAKIAGYPLPDPIKVVDSENWNHYFSRAACELGIENTYQTITHFGWYRRTFIDKSSEEFIMNNKRISKLIINFEKILHEDGFIDFDDMVLSGFMMIKEFSWVRKAIRARFPYLIIDEYQDLGIPLHKIVTQLVFTAGVEIFAVGDPDQSIYGFTGAEPNLLNSLAESENIKRVELKLNYRCGEKIINNSLISLGEKRNFESATVDSGKLYFWEYRNGVQEQAEMICNEIIPTSLKNAPGRNLGDIAVLYLDKFDAAVITEEVKRFGLNYIGGDKNVRYKPTPVTRWLEDCASWCSGGWKIGDPKLSNLVHFWVNTRNNIESELDDKLFRQLFINTIWNNRDPSTPLDQWLKNFIEIGLIENLDNSQIRVDEIESLNELISSSSNLDKMGTFNINLFGKQRGSPDHLNLVTLHSSKGLEFDVVIMMGLEQGRIPNYRISKESDSFKEERRKFYVGLTRAKREVHLVYSGWYETSWCQIFKNGPSQFVLELLKIE